MTTVPLTEPSPSETTILWSTQGGRAKACARRTSRIMRDYYYEYVCMDMDDDHNDDEQGAMLNYYGTSFDDYGPEEFLKLGSANAIGTSENNGNESNHDRTNAQKLVIMFVSTTGDGEHCDSIQATWKLLLRKSLPSNQFSNLTFALFCLGDRAYGPTAFCAAGRKLATRLTQLGAQVFCNIGYGDDGTPNGGVFNDLDKWIEHDFIPSFIPSAEIKGATDTSTGNLEKKRRKKPVSPYEVFVSPSSSTTTTNNLTTNSMSISLDENNNESSQKEEWQMRQYHTSYNQFFESLRPKNAYQYNLFTNGYRREEKIFNTMENKHEQDQNEKLSATSITDKIYVATTTHTNHPQNTNNHQSKNDNNNNNNNSCNNNYNRPLIGRVTSNKRLTSKEWKQETRHIQIHVETNNYFNSNKGSSKYDTTTNTKTHPTKIPLPYMAGDIASIIPSNPKSTVNKFLSCLPPSIQSKADAPLFISTMIIPSTKNRTNYTSWPSYCTLRGILTFCANISSLPEREDLRSLSTFCHPRHPMGNDQRSKLISLSETNDAALYGDYVIREKRSWADVLFDFDSIGYEEDLDDKHLNVDMNNNDDEMEQFAPLNIEHLLMILSPIMPRHFSIASAPTMAIVKGDRLGYIESNRKCGFNLELCVAVVKGETRHGRKYEGLCSGYLSKLNTISSKAVNLRLWIRPGSFGKLPLVLSSDSGPNDEDTFPYFKNPVICIGAGTGIAPLRSLIHEREATRKQWMNAKAARENRENLSRKDNILIFGCRKENEDYYYKEEWTSISTNGSLNVLTAFSQDQKHKTYVQHIIRENQALFIARHILENCGAVYIAGGAKMAGAVKEAIIDSLGKHLPNGNRDARNILIQLQRSGNFSVEAWS